MSLKDDILNELITHSDEYISGQAFAEQYGKSRAAVWKAVKTLEKEGYIIHAVTNRGYKLSDRNDVLNEKELKRRIPSEIKTLYYPTVDSTNSEAKRLISSGNTDTMVIVAEEQTAGRGRQGKSFYSPPLTGIYFSFVTHPMAPLKNVVTATTAAAVAVCRAIETLTDREPKIKWVNDVYLDDKKICGILTEAVTDIESGTATSVIVGIGMNINTFDFPNDVENAGCLDEPVKRVDMIAQITTELNKINNSDYSEFINYYKSHSMIIGKKINFIQNGVVTPATAVGIDDAGGLIVSLKDGTQTTLRSGEISIRKR